VDSQTRHALKQDKFVNATQNSATWVGEHRSSVLRFSIAGVVVLGLIIAAIVVYTSRSEAAETALGAALDVYSAQLVPPGQAPIPGLYASAAERAKAANAKFVDVAKQYGWLSEGGKAHYFAGLTYEEMGQNASAETELKAAADAWDKNLSSLAKFALAGFYHQTSRDPQAIDLYNSLIAKPTNVVPAFTSQLALADLYNAAGNTAKAREIWAKVKDADKSGTAGGGAAGSIAAEKLTAKK
jgi:tetratricopeptide (TPR) repeat protein